MRVLKLAVPLAGMLAVVLVAGCKQEPAPLPANLVQQIATGEQVFQRENCGECHRLGHGDDEFQGGELSSLMLAMDTLYVKKHLENLEDSTRMPPIPLNSEEISAVTQYIASLHGKVNAPVNLETIDGVCPICGAALNTAVAFRNNLWAQYGDKTYYFECPDCKKAFLRDPKRHSKSGYLRLQ